MEERDLLFEWNPGLSEEERGRRVMLMEETLREGLQSPSTINPTIEQKLRLIHLMDELGIDSLNLGIPAVSSRVKDEITAMAQEIADAKLNLSPLLSGRTLVADIIPAIQVRDKVGIPFEMALFIGVSRLRQFVEGWGLREIMEKVEESVSFAVKAGFKVMFVTEDTTRSFPEDLREVYTAAINAGASRVCFADTVGGITPEGVMRLIGYMRELLPEGVEIDWHGHRDRGLELANALTAIKAGATRVHTAALGIGERCGNTPTELVLVNLRLMGYTERDLTKLPEYCRLVSEYMKVPIPGNYPVVGKDAFRTATGVHAAAVIKAEERGEYWMADKIYSAVPATMLGRGQQIEISQMSGRSNVRYWLKKRGIEPTENLVDRILSLAKSSSRVLEEREIMEFIGLTGEKEAK